MFENKGKNIKLQVFKINKKAIKLYEKIGFKKVEETKTHYIMIEEQKTLIQENSIELENIIQREEQSGKDN